MIMHPAVIALLAGSIATLFLLLYATGYGIAILRKWDLASGSELQLRLERRTYLITTILGYVFAFQLISLFLFIATTDALHGLFSGAMCAAGTLYADAWGYPALILKIVNFLLAGVWLILNYTDNQAFDYPLIKKKYLLLLCMTPLLLAEAAAQFQYFRLLNPEVITSCCGVLFSGDADAAPTDISRWAGLPLRTIFFIGMSSLFALGVYVHQHKGGGAGVYGAASLVMFVISTIALISVFSLYIYELPTHHCPFCFLQSEYAYIGYPLYLTLFTGTIAGVGAGAIALFRKTASLSAIVPRIQKRLLVISIVSYGIYTAIISWKMIASNLNMG